MSIAVATASVICSLPFIGVISAGASIDATLESSGAGFAAIIQWGGSGNQLIGTYDSYAVTYDQSNTDNPYSTESDHCSIKGNVSGSTVNVSLMRCTNASVDGSYVAHENGSDFEFTFPSSAGTLVSVKFRSGTIGSYNRAVSDAKLLATQGNGLVTYASDYQPAESYFSPTFSKPFRVDSHWYDVMTQQINSAPDHSDSKVGAWVLQWTSYGWIRRKQLGIDTFTPPGTPFALKLARNVTAYGIEQSWMGYTEYDVIAYINHHWKLVPFAVDKRIRKAFLPDGQTSWFVNGPVFVKTFRGCINGNICGTVKVTYTFYRYSTGGAVFEITSQRGPSFSFSK